MQRNEKRVLDFIAAFLKREGYPPTMRQISNGLGESSPSWAHKRVKGLVAGGFLKAIRGAARKRYVPTGAHVVIFPEDIDAAIRRAGDPLVVIHEAVSAYLGLEAQPEADIYEADDAHAGHHIFQPEKV